MDRTLVHLLDEITAIAQLGFNYTRDPYDKARYSKLLDLAAGRYANISGATPVKQFSQPLHTFTYILNAHL